MWDYWAQLPCPSFMDFSVCAGVMVSFFHWHCFTNLMKKGVSMHRGPLGDNLRRRSQNESGSRPMHGNSVPSSSIKTCMALLYFYFCIKLLICRSHELRKYSDFFSLQKMLCTVPSACDNAILILTDRIRVTYVLSSYHEQGWVPNSLHILTLHSSLCCSYRYYTIFTEEKIKANTLLKVTQ